MQFRLWLLRLNEGRLAKPPQRQAPALPKSIPPAWGRIRTVDREVNSFLLKPFFIYQLAKSQGEDPAPGDLLDSCVSLTIGGGAAPLRRLLVASRLPIAPAHIAPLGLV